jgi:RNA polymerase sigma factor (sigma-70 family)
VTPLAEDVGDLLEVLAEVFVLVGTTHVRSYERAASFLSAARSAGRTDDMDGVRGTRDDAFERLYAEHAQALFGFLRYRTGDTALAEELLADTCERALRARRRFDPRKGSAKTWLYAIALNCLHDHARRRVGEGRALERVAAGPGSGSMGEPEEIDELADRELDGIADRDQLNRGLAALSGAEREAVSLRYGADLTLPEIAKLTGEPLTTVESRVYRALRKLREAMD